MLIIPAIDLRGGKVVRLIRGDYSQETVYSDDPIKVAEDWRNKGAELIHVVDLDGALKGKPINLEAIKKIAGCGVGIEVGGGLRERETIEQLFKIGVRRVVLGTKAVTDPDFLKTMIKEFGEGIAVGIDEAAGKVKTEGWRTETPLKRVDLARQVEKLGAKTIIYTDISRDGTLTGPNLAGLEEILDAVKLDVILSGGIGGYEDLDNAKRLESKGLAGIIIGKALYDERIDLKEAILRC